jgi:hypothetical protein
MSSRRRCVSEAITPNIPLTLMTGTTSKQFHGRIQASSVRSVACANGTINSWININIKNPAHQQQRNLQEGQDVPQVQFDVVVLERP